MINRRFFCSGLSQLTADMKFKNVELLDSFMFAKCIKNAENIKNNTL